MLGTIFVSSTSSITKVCDVQSEMSVGKIEEASKMSAVIKLEERKATSNSQREPLEKLLGVCK